MRESCKYGSARGAASNGGPYRNRREFITLFGGAAASYVSWPLVVRAEQAAKPIIGLLVPGTPASHGHWYAATVQRLRELGWVEGRTIVVEYRWAEGLGQRLPELAADLVRLKVHVIVTGGATAVIAAKQATSSIPIVFAAAADPIGSGLVANVAIEYRYAAGQYDRLP